MSDRFTFPVAVFAIFLKGDQILLGRRSNTGWKDGSYDLVAGHVDGGETFVDALRREVKEEAGITIAAEDIHFACMLHENQYGGGKEYVQVFFEVRKWQGEPKIMEPHKCDDLRWFDINNLPEKLAPATKEGLRAYKAKIQFAETKY